MRLPERESNKYYYYIYVAFIKRMCANIVVPKYVLIVSIVVLRSMGHRHISLIT